MKKIFFALLIINFCIFGAEKKTFRILSFDGGGVRGAFTAQIVAMLDQQTGFLKRVDCFAGTSTGSVIAYGLAYGLKPKEIVDLYLLHADTIFEPYLDKDTMDMGLFPKYNNERFKNALQLVIPKHVLLSHLKKKVITTSFQLHNPVSAVWEPVCFDNFHLESTTSQISVVDAVLRGSAVPVLFPSYQGYLDGAVVSNNPSMAALSRTIDKEGGNIDVSQIYMISIGTGRSHSFVPGEAKWGISGWILEPPQIDSLPPCPLLGLVMDGTSMAANQQCSQILGDRYLRIDPFMEKNILMDDCNAVPYLIEEAKKLPEKDPEAWQALLEWVQENF
jgi:hypothetical protein